MAALYPGQGFDPVSNPDLNPDPMLWYEYGYELFFMSYLDQDPVLFRLSDRIRSFVWLDPGQSFDPDPILL